MAAQTHTYMYTMPLQYQEDDNHHAYLWHQCILLQHFFYYLCTTALVFESPQALLPYSMAQVAVEAEFSWNYILCRVVARGTLNVSYVTLTQSVKYSRSVLVIWKVFQSIQLHLCMVHRYKYNTFKLPFMHLNGTVN